MMKLVEKISDLLGDEPLMDVIVACASAAAFSIKELPSDQQEHARQQVHTLIDDMLDEWANDALLKEWTTPRPEGES